MSSGALGTIRVPGIQNDSAAVSNDATVEIIRRSPRTRSIRMVPTPSFSFSGGYTRARVVKDAAILESFSRRASRRPVPSGLAGRRYGHEARGEALCQADAIFRRVAHLHVE